MKRYLYLMLCLFGVVGCKTDNIELYHSDGYISFLNQEKDTVIVSFFLLGNLQEYDLPVVVSYTGDPLMQKEPISLVLNQKGTTADAKYYGLPSPEFQPMSHLDTFYVKLNNYPELQESSVVICLELQESEALRLGDRNCRKMYLKLNDDVARPDWWTPLMETYYLGDYSDLKFRELMTAAHPDLSKVDEGLIRNWALKLKYHLEERAASPEGPVTEADGSLMSVTVNG